MRAALVVCRGQGDVFHDSRPFCGPWLHAQPLPAQTAPCSTLSYDQFVILRRGWCAGSLVTRIQTMAMPGKRILSPVLFPRRTAAPCAACAGYSTYSTLLFVLHQRLARSTSGHPDPGSDRRPSHQLVTALQSKKHPPPSNPPLERRRSQRARLIANTRRRLRRCSRRAHHR